MGTGRSVPACGSENAADGFEEQVLFLVVPEEPPAGSGARPTSCWSKFPQTHPFLFAFACASAKMALGDVIVQLSQNAGSAGGPENQLLDYDRVLAFFAFGGLYVGGAQYAMCEC